MALEIAFAILATFHLNLFKLQSPDHWLGLFLFLPSLMLVALCDQQGLTLAV